MEKARFSGRVLAYIIDIFLVSCFTSLLTLAIPTSKAVEKLYKEENEIIEKYMDSKLDAKAYVSQVMDLNYELSRQTALTSIISIFVAIIYFCVFPFYHDGQTLGKRILKMKVQKQDNSKLTMNDLVIRSSLINSIMFNILSTALVLLATKDIFLVGSTVLETIQYLFVIISVLLVAFSKDKNGLHDKIVKTEVVYCDARVKELEDAKCEN